MNLNCKVEGSGIPLVFIHGLSDNLLYWEFLASNLKGDFQIIRFDLRGHGESELGSDEITIDTYVEDLNGLLEELNISNANLIGFSLGGAIAQSFTIKYPDKVDSLVLMSSFYKADQHSFEVITQFKKTLANSFGEFFDYILPLILCPEVIEENKEELMVLKEMASLNANVDAFIKAVDVSLDFNIENEISKINVPTLVLAGKYDGVFLLESHKDLQRQIENSELIVFDNVKHNILIGENNEKILDILKSFYKK
ncbi:alpha/beta hydrolase [Methanobrevibacter sp.]|uniref:alpha/beta fold hydrolase n=1 Tax=Methanobrevibacter sp. TaxID=66852 RepID=UPI0025D1B093|nr:alpha/beta hydrolase [Methanobrevibacter sp.]MBQ2666472.1 alpha/beta hydrolase [Methanobrevibacter sp.]